MAKARFAQSRVYDTSGIGVNPNDISGDYADVNVPVSDTTKKPLGMLKNGKRRANKTGVLYTTDTLGPRDGFDFPSTEGN